MATSVAAEVPLFTQADVAAARRAGARVWCLAPRDVVRRVYSAREVHGYRRRRLGTLGPDLLPDVVLEVQADYGRAGLRWCRPQRVWAAP